MLKEKHFNTNQFTREIKILQGEELNTIQWQIPLKMQRKSFYFLGD